MPTLTIVQAEALVAGTLMRCRTGADNAAAVARALVAAEADGLKGHGLSRLAEQEDQDGRHHEGEDGNQSDLQLSPGQ